MSEDAIDVYQEAFDVYYQGYDSLGRLAKKSLSISDMKAIFDCMVRPAIAKVRELDRHSE